MKRRHRNCLYDHLIGKQGYGVIKRALFKERYPECKYIIVPERIKPAQKIAKLVLPVFFKESRDIYAHYTVCIIIKVIDQSLNKSICIHSSVF